MIYKNMEIHNAAELKELDHGVTWLRVPAKACGNLELDLERNTVSNSTGVELRFIMKSDKAVIYIQSMDSPEMDVLSVAHVYRGGIQGGWEDHEVNKYVGHEKTALVIKKSENLEVLKRMTEEAGLDWDPEVVRVIFDRGHYRIIDVVGDIEPPRREQTPSRTLLSYGSSITHGSNSLDASHAWVSVLAHRLNMDSRNLGMAGSCAMEPEMIDYIAEEGEKGKWDLATLELGINVLAWEENKIHERVTNTIRQVAGRNPEKPVILISPFYCGEDFKDGNKAKKWRKIISQIVSKENFENVHFIDGIELLGDMSLISADEVHPNIYGVQQIAERLFAFIKNSICF